jgi:hypothetical protein
MHVYEVRPRKDHRGFDLISDALPFGRLWYTHAASSLKFHLAEAALQLKISEHGQRRF